MQMTRFKKIMSFFVSIVLIAAMALSTTGCGDNNQNDLGSSTPDAIVSKIEGDVLGEGAKKFTFTVTDADGKEVSYQINTDKETVGDALMELELISGDKAEYGLYVKTVNGITVDYDKDGKYWAFYVDGEYAQQGVDSTEIVEGATYSFKVE